MFEAAIIDQITAPQFNPPAIVEQMRMLPSARVTEALVHEFEQAFVESQSLRTEAMETLASMMSDGEFKDDGEEFNSIIASFERQADEIGKKLYRIEKDVRVAQKADRSRDASLDNRLLLLARRDFEERIDVAVFWRAMQAKIWPTPVSESYGTPSDLGNALRAALA